MAEKRIVDLDAAQTFGSADDILAKQGGIPKWIQFSKLLSKIASSIAVPSNLSDLSEDAQHRTVTDEEKALWDGKSEFSGKYEDLANAPDTLPNPKKITFTGAVTGSYDGAVEMTVNIPQSTGGAGYTLPVADAQTLGGVKAKKKTTENVEVAADEEGKLFVPPYPAASGGDGVVMPANGFFTMYVDENGDLYARTVDGAQAPPFVYNEDTGELIWRAS